MVSGARDGYRVDNTMSALDTGDGMSLATKPRAKSKKSAGRYKEAVGSKTDNRDLEAEGKKDHLVGDLKHAAENVKGAFRHYAVLTSETAGALDPTTHWIGQTSFGPPVNSSQCRPALAGSSLSLAGSPARSESVQCGSAQARPGR